MHVFVARGQQEGCLCDAVSSFDERSIVQMLTLCVDFVNCCHARYKERGLVIRAFGTCLIFNMP